MRHTWLPLFGLLAPNTISVIWLPVELAEAARVSGSAELFIWPSLEPHQGICDRYFTGFTFFFFSRLFSLSFVVVVVVVVVLRGLGDGLDCFLLLPFFFHAEMDPCCELVALTPKVAADAV